VEGIYQNTWAAAYVQDHKVPESVTQISQTGRK